eukprot:scaffold76872_cov17-Tisochrysis_lutea.AAC.3
MPAGVRYGDRVQEGGACACAGGGRRGALVQDPGRWLRLERPEGAAHRIARSGQGTQGIPGMRTQSL